MSERKFYRTVYQIEVLSAEKFDEDGGMSLTDIDDELTNGSSSGKVSIIIDNEEKTGEEMAQLLKKQGSDTEFFQLTADGKDTEEYKIENAEDFDESEEL